MLIDLTNTKMCNGGPMNFGEPKQNFRTGTQPSSLAKGSTTPTTNTTKTTPMEVAGLLAGWHSQSTPKFNGSEPYWPFPMLFNERGILLVLCAGRNPSNVHSLYNTAPHALRSCLNCSDSTGAATNEGKRGPWYAHRVRD